MKKASKMKKRSKHALNVRKRALNEVFLLQVTRWRRPRLMCCLSYDLFDNSFKERKKEGQREEGKGRDREEEDNDKKAILCLSDNEFLGKKI